MEIIEPIIKFFGDLKGRDGSEINDLEIKVEYFYQRGNEWKILINSFQVLVSRFEREIDFRLVEADDDIFRPLIRTMEDGLLPIMRVSLVSADGASPANVIAQGGIAKFYLQDGRERIDIDFGTNWYLDPYSVGMTTAGDGDAEIEYEQIGLIIPPIVNDLYPAFQAALNQTDNLRTFINGEHTVSVRDIDEEDEDWEAIIADLNAQLDIERATIISLNEELDAERLITTDLNGQLEDEQAAVLALTGELDAERLITADLNLQLDAERAITADLNEQLDTERDAVASITESLEAEQAITAELTEQLETELTNVASLTDELDAERVITAELEGTVATLTEEINDIFDPEAVPASDVYSAIVSELESASETVDGSRFAVSNLSINLKAHIKNDEGGFKLQLINSAQSERLTDGTISEVQMDIISKDPIVNAPTELIMPKVNGLTETATRKRLASFGLKLNPIYQASTTQTVGQAFKQIPDAGEDVSVGETITVIFAKSNDNFN